MMNKYAVLEKLKQMKYSYLHYFYTKEIQKSGIIFWWLPISWGTFSIIGKKKWQTTNGLIKNLSSKVASMERKTINSKPSSHPKLSDQKIPKRNF
jgi:hypothetical protein